MLMLCPCNEKLELPISVCTFIIIYQLNLIILWCEKVLWQKNFCGITK